MDFRFIHFYHMNAAELNKYTCVNKPYGVILYSSVCVLNCCIAVAFLNCSDHWYNL
jgi:hypothetical protein